MKRTFSLFVLLVCLLMLLCPQALPESANRQVEQSMLDDLDRVETSYSDYVERVLAANPSPAIRLVPNPGGITDFLSNLAKLFGPNPISSLLIVMDFYWVLPGYTMMYGMDTDDIIITDRYDMIWGIYRGYDVFMSANADDEKPG